MSSTSSYRLRASTSADTSVQYKYDVFLSFRGEDTRKNFTDHVYDKLQWRGIKTFRDDPDLQRGTTISPNLLAAIEQSRFAVVVLSPNYASSTWCLLELAKIVECMGKRGTILPVFYEVDPSDVRHQRGSFSEAFDGYEARFSGEEDLKKVQEWRNALTEVANLSGWTSKDYRYESELIKEIVETLWKKVHPTFALSKFESLENLVGIDSKLMEIEYLLKTEANDVCFLGIWGMGGIGKTTLARLVYQRIANHFEVSIFLTDVRQVSATHGLVHVQKQLLCQILTEENVEVRDIYDGMTKTKRCLFNKKVLLVIDDVDQLQQLEQLAGEKDWFGSGSIIIVTTRDQRLLDLHGIEKQYKSKGLNEHEALQLFNWKAFKKDKPEEGYRDLTESILDYSRGLPLALKILGSFLYKRDRGDWESAVAKLKNAPIDQALFKALKISYEGLDRLHQQVFLDVACFLKGNDKERAIQILDSIFGFDTRIMISVLIEKSLLSIFDNCVDMHDLIQEMGREIVRLESEQEPGKRSQLWLHDDIFHVLKENTVRALCRDTEGTGAIRSIAVCLPQVEGLAWNPNAFSRMSKLKFLKMQNLVLCPGPEYLPDDIRVLEWTSYPSNSLPQNFQPVNLIELTLHHSKIHHLWHRKKHLKKLTVLDLSYSENLTKTPDFTGIRNLERLILEGCTNLVYIDPSITSLRRLKVLNFKNCRSIKSFPGELEMNSLEVIDLSGCSQVNILLQFVRGTQKLFQPFLGGIGKQLVLCNPHRLNLVLASLKHFSSLKGLHLSGCKLGEGAIPDDIGCLSSLEHLDLSANNFISLPSSISRLSKLRCLKLADCKKLEQLPCLPSFDGTCDVTANNCISLKRFPDPPELCRLWKLSFNFINCSIEDGGSKDEGVYGTVSYLESMLQRYFINCSIEDGGSKDEGVYGTVSYLESMLQRFVQEPPPYFEMFSTVIPGNNIPGWFVNQSKGHSARQASPGCSECKWMGLALCVLLGADKTPGGPLGEDHAYTISCSWQPGYTIPASVSINLNQVVTSDHLCLFLVPSKHYSVYEYSIHFTFKASAGMKVKKCAVRNLYKQDFTFEAFAGMEVKKGDVRNLYKQDSEDITIDVFSELRMNRGYAIYEMFGAVIRGNDIPVWFKYRWEQAASLHQERPCSCCKTWMGFALCVLFRAEKISGEFLNEDHGEGLEPGARKIWCCWTAENFSLARYSCVVNSSDHLCVFFIPADKFLHLPTWVDFEFKSHPSLKMEGYSVRSVDKYDFIGLPTNLANRSLKDQLLWTINNCGSSLLGNPGHLPNSLSPRPNTECIQLPERRTLLPSELVRTELPVRTGKNSLFTMSIVISTVQ